MLLVHIESPNRGAQGDSVYRTVQPCRALGEQQDVTVVCGSVLSPEILALAPQADLLVLCDVVDADLLPLVAERRAAGRLTAYEINDDFLSPQSWSPTAYLAKNLLTRSLSSRLAAGADAVQFTVAELERRFGRLHPHRAVFRNNLWQMPAARPKSPGLRVGWGGSLGHREDFAAMLPVVARVLARHPQARFSVMGAEIFRDLAAAALPPQRFSWTPAGSIERYYEFLGDLHVGLCPLQPTDFNRCRSDVKFLEYAAHRVVPLCADLEPYRETVRPGETGFLFGSGEELEALLDRVLADAALRERIAEQAAAFVAQERLESLKAPARLAFYRQRAQQLGGSLGNGSAPETPAELARHAPTYPGSRTYVLGEGPVENSIYRGLMAFRDGGVAEARAAYSKAVSQRPDFYLPHLYLGSVEPDPGRAVRSLERALKLNPRSCAALLLLAERAVSRGAAADARGLLERCAQLAPELGAAQARLGELAEGAGAWEEAVGHYERASTANPFLAQPVVRLALRALEGKRPQDAERLLASFAERDDRLWITLFLHGRALVEQARFAEGRKQLTLALERAEDPLPVLVQLAKAELGLGHPDAAKALLAEIRRLGASGAR